MRLVEVDEPAQAQFERRLVVLKVDSPECLIEFHRGHDETSLKTRHIRRRFAEGLNAVVLTRGIKFIPQFERKSRLDPEFVSKVTRETGARHHERVAMEWKSLDVERFCGVDAVEPHVLQRRAGCGSLQGERRKVIGHVRDTDVVESECAFFKPCGTWTAAGQHEFIAAQFENRAVIDHAAFVGTPDTIAHPVESDLGNVSRHHSVQHRFGITAAYFIFLHRADVVGRTGIANAKVLVFAVVVALGELVAVPRRPRVANIELFRPGIKGRPFEPFARVWVSRSHNLFIVKVIFRNCIGTPQIDEYFACCICTAHRGHTPARVS